MQICLTAALWRSIQVIIVVGLTATSVFAQSRFEPVISVGDTLITRFELDERISFLELLNAPGDLPQLARDQLINAAIQVNAARRAGVGISEEELTAALAEFAGRANLTTEEFVTALDQNGVGASTFESFVSTGIIWRNYVRARFGEVAREVPQSFIQRSLTRTGTEGGQRVRLTEILLPTNTEATRAASLARASELASLDGETEFRSAARRFSIAPSRANGGEVGWRELSSLPEEVQAAIGGLSVGEISRPIDLGGAIAIYFLNEAETIAPGTPEELNVDFVTFRIGEAPGEDARIASQVDTCNDFFGLITTPDDPRFQRQSIPNTSLSPTIRSAIRTLDANETTVVTLEGARTLVMLCGRTIDSESNIDLNLVGTRLLNEKLTTLAAHHLDELRASTIIEDLTN